MCQSKPPTNSPNKTVNDRKDPSFISKIEFRQQTNISQSSNGPVCHALPCNIHTTSEYANVAGYFQPTSYLTEKSTSNPRKRKFIGDTDDDEDDEKVVVEEETPNYLIAQFRGRSIMARDEDDESSSRGVPLSPNMVGLVMMHKGEHNSGARIEVVSSFHNVLEWQLADNVGQMEHKQRQNKGRLDKVNHWMDLSAAVHDPIPI